MNTTTTIPAEIKGMKPGEDRIFPIESTNAVRSACYRYFAPRAFVSRTVMTKSGRALKLTKLGRLDLTAEDYEAAVEEVIPAIPGIATHEFLLNAKAIAQALQLALEKRATKRWAQAVQK